MGNIRTLHYQMKPSAKNVRQALEAVEAHERAGNYTEAEAIRERIRTGIEPSEADRHRYVTELRLTA